MRIIENFCFYGTEKRDGFVAIPELDRTGSSVRSFQKLFKNYHGEVHLNKPTALIYVDGFTISQAEAGLNATEGSRKIPILRSGSSYIAHEWAYTLKGHEEHLKHLSIATGTCAAGIQALHEADRLLKDQTNDIEEVIIIGGERTTPATINLFKELGIPVTCGDGFCYFRLDAYGHDISMVKWKFAMNNNPFRFKKEDLDTLAPNCRLGYVKLHGTGTADNEEAESGLAKLGTPLRYKDVIGHTQGVSALVETSMVLGSSRIKGRILVTANGVGGFYGSFLLTK